jgi:hypothetical protein
MFMAGFAEYGSAAMDRTTLQMGIRANSIQIAMLRASSTQEKLAFAGCEQGSGLDAAAERSGRNERAGRSGEWAAATTYESRIMQQS